MENSKTTNLTWALIILSFVIGMLLLHVPGAAKLDAIAPVDLIYNHAPWDKDIPEDLIIGSNVQSDQFDYVHPTYAYLVNSLREGSLPIYTSLIGNGTPFFFTMTHYGSNPLALGLGVMFGAAHGYTLYLFLLTGLAALCFFDLLRSYKLHPMAALWGVMILIFSTTSVSAIGIPMSDQMFFTVMIMWSVRKILLVPKTIFFFPLTFASYLLLTSAYPPGTITAGLFLIAFTMMEAVAALRAGRFEMRQLWIGIAALITILLLASPFLVESAHMFLSDDGINLESREGEYARWRLANGAPFVSFHPRLLGDAPGVILSRWGPRWFFDMNYFGVATVVLIFAALLCIRRYKRVSFFFVAFVLYLITIYTYKGLYPQTLGQLPLLSGVRAYAHIYMWVICIAALSAYGVQSQLSSKIGPWGKTIALSIGLVGTVWIAAYLSSFHPILQETVDADPNPSRAVLHWLPTGLLTLALVQHLLSLMRKRAEEQTASLPTESLILAALFVTSYDLLSVSSGVNRTVAEEHYFPTHPAIEKLQAIQGHDKIMPLNNGLPSLVHLPYGIRSIGFRGFFTERARNVVREYAPTFPTDRIATQFNHPPSSTDLAHPFIELMGVKYFTDLTSSYVLDEFDTKEDNSGPYPRVRKIRSEGISIYENLDYSGRAHITPSCIERSEDEMLAEITATRADLTRFVFRKECPSTRLQAGRARIVNEEPGRIGVAIESTGPTILVLGDNYANGWRAEANGEPISVFRANYNFIGIDVPAGTERVVLRYAPTGLWPAIYLAATAWLLLIGGFLYRVFRSTWPQIQKTRKTMMSAASINTRR